MKRKISEVDSIPKKKKTDYHTYNFQLLNIPIILNLQDTVEIEKSKQYTIKNTSEADRERMRQAMKELNADLDFEDNQKDVYLPGHRITILDLIGRRTKFTNTISCRLMLSLNGFVTVNYDDNYPLWEIKKIMYNFQ